MILPLKALAAGLCLGLPSLWPALWPLALIGLVLTFQVVEAAPSWSRVAVLSWLVGACCLAVVSYPLSTAMMFFYHLTAWASLGLFGLYLLLFANKLVLLAVLIRWTPRELRLAIYPMAMVAVDLIQVSVIPWYFAATQSGNLPALQVADVVGIAGVAFPLGWVATALHLGIQEGIRLKPTVAAVGMIVLVYGYGLPRMADVATQEAAAPSVRVALIQPDTPRGWRGNLGIATQVLETCRRLTWKAGSHGPVDLIVWPEGSAPFSYATRENPMDLRFRAIVEDAARTFHSPILVNDDRYEGALHFNSVELIAPDGRLVANYKKNRLFPFSEYMPGSDIWPALKGTAGSLDFTPGHDLVVLPTPDMHIGPLLCYEALFPALARQLTRQGADCLVTMTNDGLFGPTPESFEHLMGAVPRAIENRRPLVRCANTGISTVVSASGQIATRMTGLYEEDVLLADVHPLHIWTFYTRYGDVFGWTCVILLSILLSWSHLRRAR